MANNSIDDDDDDDDILAIFFIYINCEVTLNLLCKLKLKIHFIYIIIERKSLLRFLNDLIREFVHK